MSDKPLAVIDTQLLLDWLVFADPAAHRDLIAVAGDDARLILARDPALQTNRGRALKVLQALFDWQARLNADPAG